MKASRLLLNLGSLAVLLAALGGSLEQLPRLHRVQHEVIAANASLARDRSELQRLSQQSRSDPAKRMQAEAGGQIEDDDTVIPAMSRSVLEFVRRLHAAKDWFVANPAQHIPEMGLLSESDWITLVGQANLDTDDGTRQLAAAIRQKAEQNFAQQDVKAALERYRTSHGDDLPARLDELDPFLPNAAASDALNRYEMLATGSGNTPAATNRAIGLRPDSIVDPARDAAVWIGSTGVSMSMVGSPPILQLARGEAEAAYANAHNGMFESDLAKILPYFRSPADAAAAAEADRKWQAELAARAALR